MSEEEAISVMEEVNVIGTIQRVPSQNFNPCEQADSEQDFSVKCKNSLTQNVTTKSPGVGWTVVKRKAHQPTSLLTQSVNESNTIETSDDTNRCSELVEEDKKIDPKQDDDWCCDAREEEPKWEPQKGPKGQKFSRKFKCKRGK